MAAEKKILLALADSKLRKRVKSKILEPAGYRVSVVSDCKAARADLEKNRPALCFLGDDLPDGDPLELAEERARSCFDRLSMNWTDGSEACIRPRPSQSPPFAGFSLTRGAGAAGGAPIKGDPRCSWASRLSTNQARA